jgi:Na+-driven multidrug efflux pump
VAFVLAFAANLGLEGLWIGITVALGICGLASVAFSLRLDYEGEAAKAKLRMA